MAVTPEDFNQSSRWWWWWWPEEEEELWNDVSGSFLGFFYFIFDGVGPVDVLCVVVKVVPRREF